MRADSQKAKRKRTPIQRRMVYLSDWIRMVVKQKRRERMNPFSITMADDAWNVIRRALNKASKP